MLQYTLLTQDGCNGEKAWDDEGRGRASHEPRFAIARDEITWTPHHPSFLDTSRPPRSAQDTSRNARRHAREREITRLLHHQVKPLRLNRKPRHDTRRHTMASQQASQLPPSSRTQLPPSHISTGRLTLQQIDCPLSRHPKPFRASMPAELALCRRACLSSTRSSPHRAYRAIMSRADTCVGR